MNKIKSILMAFASLLLVFSCTKDQPFGSTDFVDNAPAPSDLKVLVDIHPDQTGNVTISPTGAGVSHFGVLFGDGTTDTAFVALGSSVDHMYAEGNYDVKVLGYNTAQKFTETVQSVEISLAAPENVEIKVENVLGVSKKVNVTANATYGQSFDVYFLEGMDPLTGNIGETVSYTYEEAGTYDIKVVVKSASATTYEEVITHEAVMFLQPAVSAPLPPERAEGSYISIFSDAYTDLEGTNFNPDWGQGGQGSSYALFDLEGDAMQQYINLSYQGIEFTDIDVSDKEFIHLDVWTGTLTQLEVSLIQRDGGERPVTVSLTPDAWESIDIPVSAFTSQDGFEVSSVFQIKLVATGTDEWATGSVFVDNIYFYTSVSEKADYEIPGMYAGLFGFGGTNGSIIDNPDASGLNTSAKVLSLEKTAGAETWAGAGYALEHSIDFSKGTKLKMHVWSPKVGAIIKFKIEDSQGPKDEWGNAAVFAEVDVVTTKAGEWEEMVFDLTSWNGFSTDISYDVLVLFADFGQWGAGETYYFDNLELVN